VEVSPSMVMRLKEASAASLTRRCISSGAMAGTVATRPSIGAMFGRIRPAPLGMGQGGNNQGGLELGQRGFKQWFAAVILQGVSSPAR